MHETLAVEEMGHDIQAADVESSVAGVRSVVSILCPGQTSIYVPYLAENREHIDDYQ